VMVCTYNYGSNIANQITPETWMNVLAKTANAKVVLMHAGAVRLMEYMEIARAFPNVLMDLSLTLCKYKGSSIDSDLKFMFQYFDQRICIGSDFPEFSLLEVRNRFEEFSSCISLDKKENIAYKNIVKFSGLNISL